MLNIRNYQACDYDQVMELHILALQQVGAYKGDGPWDDDLNAIEQVYLNNHGAFLVGELEGQIVAMGAFKKSEQGFAEVKRMRLESLAKELGYIGLHLETSERQVVAQKLYRKHGFQEVGRMVIDGLNCILFEKKFT
jgi:ribosomal protein S18 acetylase RimI-like enzyme